MTDLSGEVGGFLGWGRNPSKWSDRKKSEVMACLATALRKFYFQASVSERDKAHNWTFLKPVATITLTTSESTAPLPDDFGGFEGEATVAQDGLSGGFWPCKIVHEQQIRTKYAAFPSITGRPVAIAEQQVKGATIDRSNRSQLYVYPIPDHSYQISVPYYILPEMLTTVNRWAYGGAAHAETLKAGCRAAAELLLDNTVGEQNAAYMQCLVSSIEYDRRHQPKSLGINSDRSDFLNQFRGHWPDGLWHPLGIGFLSEATYL